MRGPKERGARGAQRPGRRIAFAYGGSLLVFLVLVPLAISNTMGGHSLIFIALLATPTGAAVGLTLADCRLLLSRGVAVLEVLAAMAAGVVWVVVVGSFRSPAFLLNRGWVLIPAGGPLLAAAASSVVIAWQFRRGNSGE